MVNTATGAEASQQEVETMSQSTLLSETERASSYLHAAESELLTTPASNQYLGFKPGFLENRRSTGTGPPFARISARCVRYRRCDLDAWIAGLLRTSTSDPGPQANAA